MFTVLKCLLILHRQTNTNTMKKEQTFIISFGTGIEQVNLTEIGADLLEVLSKLDRNGWEVENITSIKINPINI